ncbi:hypothetical protein [Sphingomicrobium nitratireducens]|uniref:hypothetical protein n=1 Tax=Sphingomicrobium nitratireducens TaxID=2964666 RepID=UPI00223F1207|nr:hypothetical protein [Sphingomicrobium nitratireducens]
MTSLRIRTAIAALAATALTAAPAIAEKANQLGTLVGLDASGAESALHSRGFKHISSRETAMGYSNSYWWDGGDRSCVVVEEYGAKVMTINDGAASDCGHSESGSGAGAAVAAVAGAAILGAILSHKSDHHSDGKHHSDAAMEAEYDRGYTDGLHGASYHNYGRSDAYSDGYSAGVDQREANLSHHHRRGGYVQTAAFADLQGARASAIDQLSARGFRQVDNFVSGTARYSIWSRPSSNQCLQVITADGRLEDIRDIGRHPKCR